MDWRFKKKTRLIREFSKGSHSENVELQEDYLDWFFLRYFNREPSYWRGLTDDKIESLMALENETEGLLKEILK